jgi:hypothetical protein
MVIRDWRDPADYAFTAGLDGAGWAWEFLRRNPDYQAEWAEFNRIWQALEAAYGRPPQRDFCAWKLDPRAWVRASDCPQGDCRVDQDKVLIECALGARWGFYRFPPDPADDDPVGAGRLSFRELDQQVPLLGPADHDWLGDEPARVALGFDLALPLRGQLEQAKRLLQLEQRRRQRAGEVQPLSLKARGPSLAVMLRLLDGQAAGAEAQALAGIAGDAVARLREARALQDGGYRRLVLLPR